ncbi:MAG: hypothetical protein JO273_16180 [Methylobacteriaceae bacterium]|nr:hypothetical protein [Methylobacteriaceae bacterium]
MLQTLVVTIGAGLAGMLLFIVSAKGSLAAAVITYFTPLPIMIAALGWSQFVGLAAALLGAILIAFVLHPILGAIYAGAFALPAWWLSYLALLARFETPTPAHGTAPGSVQREWYPIGRVVLWAAVIATVATIAGVLSVSFTSAGFEDAARAGAREAAPVIEQVLGSRQRLPAGVSAEDLAAFVIHGLTIASAGALSLMHLVNLWLAGRTTELSHRLARPWPNLPDNLRLPRFVAVVFPIALAIALVFEGYAGLFAAMAAAALAVGLALHGLAAVHALTRGHPGRVAILVALYGAIVLLMPWPLILLIIFGLADLVLALRERRAARSSTPQS